jgi:polysaccharide biosynthesis protein PelC
MTLSGSLRFGATLALGAFLLSTCGCAAGNRIFVNSEADQSFFRKVAVLPFANVSGNALAAPRVTRAFVTEMTIAELYDVIEPELVREELVKLGAEMDATGRYPTDKVKAVVAKLGAQGYIQGTVTDYSVQRHGDDEVPVLGFDVQMVDLATEKVAWRVTVVGKGKGRVPVVGGGLRTLGQLTQNACESAVADVGARVTK